MNSPTARASAPSRCSRSELSRWDWQLLFVVGLISALGAHAGDYTLALVSAAALLATGFFFWNLLTGIKRDACRSLDARLEELKQLRQHHLLSPEEFTGIEAHILIARQRQASS